MRKLELSNGKTIEIHPLTYKQFTELRGKNLEYLDEILYIAELQGLKPKEVEEWPMPDCIALQREVNAETFPKAEETKN